MEHMGYKSYNIWHHKHNFKSAKWIDSDPIRRWIGIQLATIPSLIDLLIPLLVLVLVDFINQLDDQQRPAVLEWRRNGAG